MSSLFIRVLPFFTLGIPLLSLSILFSVLVWMTAISTKYEFGSSISTTLPFLLLLCPPPLSAVIISVIRVFSPTWFRSVVSTIRLAFTVSYGPLFVSMFQVEKQFQDWIFKDPLFSVRRRWSNDELLVWVKDFHISKPFFPKPLPQHYGDIFEVADGFFSEFKKLYVEIVRSMIPLPSYDHIPVTSMWTYARDFIWDNLFLVTCAAIIVGVLLAGLGPEPGFPPPSTKNLYPHEIQKKADFVRESGLFYESTEFPPTGGFRSEEYPDGFPYD